MYHDHRKWWKERGGFFGKFYMEGDNSREGHLSKKLSLRGRTRQEVNGVIKLLNLKSGEKILDLPCGYGRHSLELAMRGFIVTGSDINSTHLDSAIKKSLREKLSVHFHRENMLRINYKNEFDAVINMFYSFGFFETDAENTQVLKNFFRALKPNGKFLMHTDVNIPRIISGKYKLNETRALCSGGKLKIVERFDYSSRRINGKWIISDPNGNVEEKDYSVRVYEKDEFIQMCLTVGFRKCEAYSSWDGDPYSEDSEEIMFVATK